MTTELVDDAATPVEGAGVVTHAAEAVPPIPNGVETDVPPPEEATSFLVPTPPDPQGEHTRWMAKYKLTFAVWVVIICFIVVVGLSITQFVTQKFLDSAALNSAIDWAKSIATIALGFALGRSFEEAKKEAG